MFVVITHQISGTEHFELKEVIHTRNPVLSQFDLLLSQGDINMDHIMKRLDSGSAHERGPSFKIKPNSRGLLFPKASNIHYLKNFLET